MEGEGEREGEFSDSGNTGGNNENCSKNTICRSTRRNTSRSSINSIGNVSNNIRSNNNNIRYNNINNKSSGYACVCVRARVCACACACVRVRVRMRACVEAPSRLHLSPKAQQLYPPLLTVSRRSSCFLKEPLSFSIYESCSTDLLKRTNVTTLGAPVALATAPCKIHTNLAVATVSFLAVAASIC